MREICNWCMGTGEVRHEDFFHRDLNGNKLFGFHQCGQCKGKGHVDWFSVELHKWEMERRQRKFRKAVELGGSVYSAESRFFDVTQVRWGAISAVYFSPEKVCELLGLVFPSDLQDVTEAVKHAAWTLGWRVTPLTGERKHILRCRAIERQLHEQYDIHEFPEFQEDFPRDDRTFTKLYTLSSAIFYWRRGDLRQDWREAVAAVKATRENKDWHEAVAAVKARYPHYPAA